MRRSTLALFVFASLACGPFQTYGQGMRVICDAPLDCVECRGGDPAQQATLLAAHIQANLWNPTAIDVFRALAMASPEQKGLLLREAAAEAGVTPCPITDAFALAP
jgi:hypothetical protein